MKYRAEWYRFRAENPDAVLGYEHFCKQMHTEEQRQIFRDLGRQAGEIYRKQQAVTA